MSLRTIVSSTNSLIAIFSVYILLLEWTTEALALTPNSKLNIVLFPAAPSNTIFYIKYSLLKEHLLL
jgi:hypothetical protein